MVNVTLSAEQSRKLADISRSQKAVTDLWEAGEMTDEAYEMQSAAHSAARREVRAENA